MKNRFFYTTGKQDIIEHEYDKSEPASYEVEVKNVMTGVCRSDIDMYDGKFHLPSIYMQGHEGLGQVTKVGEDVTDIQIGDFVATRGEPAFADYYNCHMGSCVVVPEASPKYIIEPVACAINLYYVIEDDLKLEDEIIILGTGFLATTLYKTLRYHLCHNKITVVGNANKDFWENAEGVELYSSIHDIPRVKDTRLVQFFDIVFDLSPKPEYVEIARYLADNGIIIMGAEKHPNTPLPLDLLLWKSARIEFPSPRNERFKEAMELGVTMIDEGELDTSSLWTQEYDRSEVKQAFEDGLNRPEGYSRGFIKW
jgi:D-arabinose 1-dehydrogenase-like Zn-dependent alcohol dehydrogenase